MLVGSTGKAYIIGQNSDSFLMLVRNAFMAHLVSQYLVQLSCSMSCSLFNVSKYGVVVTVNGLARLSVHKPKKKPRRNQEGTKKT